MSGWWNFHTFTLGATVVFYVMLRMYKRSVESGDQKSNLMYVLYVPSVLYAGYFLFGWGNTSNTFVLQQATPGAPPPATLKSLQVYFTSTIKSISKKHTKAVIPKPNSKRNF